MSQKKWVLVNWAFSDWISFLLQAKTKRDQALLRHVNGEIGPQSAQFWAQLRASQDTSFKIKTLIGCCGANFSINMTWKHLILFSLGKKRPKKQFLETSYPQQEEIQSANVQFGKAHFFRQPVQKAGKGQVQSFKQDCNCKGCPRWVIILMKEMT